MMKIGYGRTSTIDQVAGLDAQLRDLKEAGCEKVFSEQISSKASRRELEAALEYCREGDTLVVTKLDRLARSISDLVKIRERLETKGVALVVLKVEADQLEHITLIIHLQDTSLLLTYQNLLNSQRLKMSEVLVAKDQAD